MNSTWLHPRVRGGGLGRLWEGFPEEAPSQLSYERRVAFLGDREESDVGKSLPVRGQKVGEVSEAERVSRIKDESNRG